MDKIINDISRFYYHQLTAGPTRTWKSIPCCPATGTPWPMPPLTEALVQNLIAVTEVCEGGSVPELKVVNKSGTMVLILDGEELIGAKQNRVVNTTS